jgi:hypothetical protein
MSSKPLVEDVRKLLQVLSSDFGRAMVQQTPGTLVSYDLAERLSGLPHGALRKKICQMDWHDVVGKYIGIADMRGGMTYGWRIRGMAQKETVHILFDYCNKKVCKTSYIAR